MDAVVDDDMYDSDGSNEEDTDGEGGETDTSDEDNKGCDDLEREINPTLLEGADAVRKVRT